MFETGTLSDRIEAVTDHGLRCGALQPISTACRFVQDGDVRFLVRVVENLTRKQRVSHTNGREGVNRRNPFLPYDVDLYVADVSKTHVCLLNKFNVVDRHLLIVTRRFEQQESALTQQDFGALSRCMAEYDALGFYNSGTIAGASQPHKHLQLVPLPFVPEGPRMPIEPLLAAEAPPNGVGYAPSLAFRHALIRLDAGDIAQPPTAVVMLKAYRSLLQALRIEWPSDERQTIDTPYNLLTTREWMMMVPRTRECFESISFNSLAFVGALLVRCRQEMEMLEAAGPMQALRYVTLSSTT
jgi:ATP adenylyltransferase